jgi:anti-anti-sigma factor
MLRINIERNDGTATLYCTGRLVFGLETETLRSITKSRSERALVFDLAGIETVDASGLGALVELQHWATRCGRKLSFVNASDFVSRLLMLTRLDCVLNISPRAASQIQQEQCPIDSAALIA